MPSSPSTRRANKATAGDLALSVLPRQIKCNKNFSVSVKMTSDMCDEERDQIWRTFDDNMSELYRSSSFGWHPQKKKKEMFHTLSRFILVRDASDVVAYTIFRFEHEARQDVVYCYELQVSKDARRFGLGRSLMQMLSDIGAQWGMSKIMLTVFKANNAAVLFYKSVGFVTDEESPEDETSDYSILSKCTNLTPVHEGKG